MEISNKTLAMFLVAAVVISLAGTIISLNKITQLGLTGYATVNATGTALLTVSSLTSIKFALNSIDFGSGSVNTSLPTQNCTMYVNDSTGINRAGGNCTGFNSAGDAFVIENDGNTYLNVTMNCSSNVSEFVNGSLSIAWFQYTISNNESGSCVGSFNQTISSGWANVTKIDTNICTNLSYTDATDSLRMGIKVVIPYDAITGARTATFRVTGVG